MELLKYCRNVANVKTFWYNEVVPKNRHPHLRLKHRRADAEHIRPETNPIQVSFRMEEYIMKKLSKRFSYPRNRLCYGHDDGRTGVCRF
jgi:hypothetical protein